MLIVGKELAVCSEEPLVSRTAAESKCSSIQVEILRFSLEMDEKVRAAAAEAMKESKEPSQGEWRKPNGSSWRLFDDPQIIKKTLARPPWILS